MVCSPRVMNKCIRLLLCAQLITREEPSNIALDVQPNTIKIHYLHFAPVAYKRNLYRVNIVVNLFIYFSVLESIHQFIRSHSHSFDQFIRSLIRSSYKITRDLIWWSYEWDTIVINFRIGNLFRCSLTT